MSISHIALIANVVQKKERMYLWSDFFGRYLFYHIIIIIIIIIIISPFEFFTPAFTGGGDRWRLSNSKFPQTSWALLSFQADFQCRGSDGLESSFILQSPRSLFHSFWERSLDSS